MRTRASAAIAAFLSSRLGSPACSCSTSSICLPTLRIGLSAVRGLWKIIAISRPRSSRIASGARRQKIDAADRDVAFGDPRRLVEEAHDGVGRDRLAGSAFADDADDLAAARPKRDVVQRPHRAVTGAELQLTDCRSRAAAVIRASSDRADRAVRRPAC